MKTINKLFFFILLASLSLVSCNQNDFDTPPIDVPHYTGAPANMKIKDLKTAHALIIAGKTADLIKDPNMIISGVVIANDKSGNLYKKLVIQDETGAIDLAINQTGLYTIYPVGQKVFIKCDGLYIGGYGGQAQLGGLYNEGVGQMTQATFESKVALDGLPNKENLPAVKELAFADLGKTGVEDLKGTVVKFKGVHFENGGKDIFSAGTTNELMQRNLVLSTGEKLAVRTSSFATFAKMTLPKGTGDIIVILGSFNGTWQLTLRSTEDLINFDGKDVVDPVTPPSTGNTKTTPYDFAAAKANQGKMGWVKGYIVGAVDGITLSTGAKFAAPFTGLTSNILVAASSTEKSTANCLAIQLPAGAVKDALNLDAHADNLGKEILFYGSLENYFGTAGVKNVTAAYLAGGPLIGNEPIDVSGAIFSETFAAGLGAFKSETVVGTAAWTNDAKYKCMKISGQINKLNTDAENWLISPAIDLSKVKTASLTFNHAVNFSGNSDDNRKAACKVLVSTDYNTGAPSTGTWTEVAIPSYPTTDSWGFINAGKLNLPVGSASVHIAFKYKSTSTVCPAWEVQNIVVQ